MMIKIEDLRNVKDLLDIEGLEIKNYISMKLKENLIESLVDILVEEDEYGLYVVNAIDKEIKAKVAMVTLYTNIEVTYDDYLNYDILKENNLLSHIELLPCCCDDISQFYKMLDERISDKLSENSVGRITAIRSKELVRIFDRAMAHLDSMLDKGDPNAIAKYLSRGVELIAKKMPDFSRFDIDKVLKSEVK